MAASLVDTFTAWGYEVIATPVVEPLATIAAGLGEQRLGELFRFMDSNGELLALVGERTVSAARVVATSYAAGPFPLRLCYAGPVLRNSPPLAGRRRETLQAGCELVGSSAAAADAECIALAITGLDAAGLGEVQVDVGHAGFIPALLDAAGIEPQEKEAVLDAFSHHDLVAVESALRGTEAGEAERRLLLAAPTLRGGRDILDTAAAGLGGAPLGPLEELGALWSLLEGHGVADRIHLDLGAVRDWGYYTGPIFEVFTAAAGFPLGGGGRYDGLLGRFGTERPATGFVIHVDRCVDALLRDDPPTGGPVRVAWTEGGQGRALAAARRLRADVRAAVCAVEALAAPDGEVVADLVVGPTLVRWRDAQGWREGDSEDAMRALGRAP